MRQTSFTDSLRPLRHEDHNHAVSQKHFTPSRASKLTPLFLVVPLVISLLAAACQAPAERRNVRPLVLRDVPAQRLAYRFEADTGSPKVEDSSDKLAAIQTDFNTRRSNEALIRTVVSPDTQRALALYGTSDDSGASFRIDLYASGGQFLRNLTPSELAAVFPETVAWSADGNYITFIGHRNIKPSPSPTPLDEIATEVASSSPSPSPTVAPAFASVPVYNTEQIYICNRDGYDLKPVTAREGLIYFYFAWAPDNHALVALACKENEWNAREKEYKLPAGRPRLLTLDGKERLLDDQLTEALPVWSSDSSKVATAFDTDIGIYDAATNTPTQARIPLRDALVAASTALEQRTRTAKKAADNTGGKAGASAPQTEQAGSLPASFNPIVSLHWPSPEKLYVQTAYVRLGPSEPINTFQRWHLVILSPQAALLK